MSSDFWKSADAWFDEQDKHTVVGPYPSITLFKADKSNGWVAPDAMSHVRVAGSVKIAVEEANVEAVSAVAAPQVSP